MTGRLLTLCGADWTMVRQVADRKGHDLRYAVDDGKIRTELGYAPRWSLDRGLAEVVEWYRTHPQWWGPLVGTDAVAGLEPGSRPALSRATTISR
jgi:dTDP-glucose 4,6-dehydratase